MPTDGVIGPSPRRAVEKAFFSKVRATGRDFTQEIVEKFGHGGRLRPEVKDAAEEWATMCAAIAVSGGGESSFADSGGYPSPQQIARELEEAKGALEVLLQACAAKAPALVADPLSVLPLARLAVWVPQGQWVRGIEDWEGAEANANASTALRSLSAHLLETYDTPPVLHAALGFCGNEKAALVPEGAHRVSYAFTQALVAAGAGKPVREALNAAIGANVVSKSSYKVFVKEQARDSDGPLMALRRAQVAAQNAPDWVADAVCESKFGRRLLGGGSGRRAKEGEGERSATDGLPAGVNELVGLAFVDWVCKHAQALQEPAAVSTALDYALEMRASQDEGFSLAGRTPKTIAAGMEAYALTNTKFSTDEIFEPNPYGIRGLFIANATIPEGTVVQVPYDEPFNGGHGKYMLGAGSPEGRGVRACTVRVAEIGSLGELIREGNRLNNCLENRYDSQVKYVMRQRQRTSSFWSFTFTYAGAVEPTHVLLLEIWHLRQGHIVRQAEGPRPRTLPGPEAWYWMVKWCESQGVQWETWDVYSRVTAPIPKAPVL